MVAVVAPSFAFQLPLRIVTAYWLDPKLGDVFGIPPPLSDKNGLACVNVTPPAPVASFPTPMQASPVAGVKEATDMAPTLVPLFVFDTAIWQLVSPASR
jgi:hypothetical protein